MIVSTSCGSLKIIHFLFGSYVYYTLLYCINNLKQNIMKTFAKDQQTLVDLKKKYPNAKKIQFGNNNLVDGFWFEKGENAKCRSFYILNK